MRFLAAAGSRVSPEQAARWGAELYRLYTGGVRLTPENIVATARRARSPLHDAFTWDDTEAARLYRLREARNMMASITVITRNEEGERSEPVRFFVNVQDGAGTEDEEERVYVPLNIVRGTPDLSVQMLAQALRELQVFRRKYGLLQNLEDIVNWPALDKSLGDSGSLG